MAHILVLCKKTWINDSQTTYINGMHQQKTESILCLISVLWTNITFNTSRYVFFNTYLQQIYLSGRIPCETLSQWTRSPNVRTQLSCGSNSSVLFLFNLLNKILVYHYVLLQHLKIWDSNRQHTTTHHNQIKYNNYGSYVLVSALNPLLFYTHEL
jgi:hypothetical protein